MNFIKTDMMRIIEKVDKCLYRYAQNYSEINMDFAHYAEEYFADYQRELKDPHLTKAELAYLLRKAARSIFQKARKDDLKIKQLESSWAGLITDFDPSASKTLKS